MIDALANSHLKVHTLFILFHYPSSSISMISFGGGSVLVSSTTSLTTSFFKNVLSRFYHAVCACLCCHYNDCSTERGWLLLSTHIISSKLLLLLDIQGFYFAPSSPPTSTSHPLVLPLSVFDFRWSHS